MTNNPSPIAQELSEKILTECIFLSPDDTKTQASFTKAQAIIQTALDKAAADGAKRMQVAGIRYFEDNNCPLAAMKMRQLNAEQISKGE